MEKILVTGAAGFIGSKTVELLLNNDYEVIGIDNLNDYYSIELKQFRINQLINYKNFTFDIIDIENYEKLKKIFEYNNFSAIINLAARAGVRASIENPYIYVSTNIIGTLNLLELAKDYNINKFVLASSSSIYAGEQTPFSEDMPVNNPISQYAASKKAAEMMVHSYHHLYGIDSTILRFFTVYGPAGRPDMSYYQFIKKIYCNIPITLYGNGSQSRDFTYVDDIAEGVISALKPVGYEIINLGGGRKPITINEMIRMIEKRLNKKAIIEYKQFHSADMSETGANIQKAKSILNWHPTVSFEEGINKTCDWFINNPQAFEFV